MVGEILEMWVKIGPFVASQLFGVTVPVIVHVVRPCDIADSSDGEGVLGVGKRGVVYLLGRGNIATCGHSTSYASVREEESDDECSEVDHCETVEGAEDPW